MNRILLILFLMTHISLLAQSDNYTIVDSIVLKDRSFEVDSIHHSSWIDLGFKKYTPPGIHTPKEVVHDVQLEAAHGNNFLELVSRHNETYEEIGQFLDVPLLEGKKYLFKLSICHFPAFKGLNTLGKLSTFEKPITIRVKAFNIAKGEVTRDLIYVSYPSLFVDSKVIKNTEWEEIYFYLEPKHNYNFISIQSWFKVPAIMGYNGHVLIDDISNIFEIKYK